MKTPIPAKRFTALNRDGSHECPTLVIPAKAGIQAHKARRLTCWAPAFAGATRRKRGARTNSVQLSRRSRIAARPG